VVGVGEKLQAEQKVMLAEAKALRTQSLSPSKAKGGGGAAPKAAPTCRLEGKGKREEERRIVHRRAAAQRPPKVAGSMTAFFQAATQKVRARVDAQSQGAHSSLELCWGSGQQRRMTELTGGYMAGGARGRRRAT
jgi:hypothetical protein